MQYNHEGDGTVLPNEPCSWIPRAPIEQKISILNALSRHKMEFPDEALLGLFARYNMEVPKDMAKAIVDGQIVQAKYLAELVNVVYEELSK